MMKTARHCIAIAGVALLSACGGGGDDAGASPFIPPTDDFAVGAGWTNLLRSGGSWTVSGTGSDGAAYEATLQIAPATAAVFPLDTRSYDRTTILATVRASGIPQSTTTVEYFREVDDRLAGARRTVASVPECALSTSNALPPAAAKVGASGALATLDNYNSCLSGALPNGTTTARWSLEFDRAVVLLCLASEARNATNQVTGSEKDCVEIATDGRLGTRARITIVDVSRQFSLTMNNF